MSKFKFERFVSVARDKPNHIAHYGVFDKRARLVPGTVRQSVKFSKRAAMARLNADSRHPNLAWKRLTEQGYACIKVEIYPAD